MVAVVDFIDRVLILKADEINKRRDSYADI